MKCPRCDSAALDERDRNGVTVDLCPQCRGVWLDRGELEKLLAFAKRDLEEERSYYSGSDAGPPSSDRRPGGSVRAEQAGQAGQGDVRHRHPRKKGWLENLGDIFD